MNKTVKPLKVSPTIKAARWSLLFLGIFFGASRLDTVREIDKRARPMREKQIKEKYERLTRESKLRSTEEIISMAKEFEITEFPEGWDNDL